MMSPRMFLSCHRCATLLRGSDNGEGYANMEADDKWEIFATSSQFRYEHKIPLKKSLKVIFKK